MIKLDLITGFLGAGKTSFLIKYARELMARGLKICILESDHGAVNVDMMLLASLRGESCELEMLAGACDPGCHMRRLRTKLISMAMSGYDRVIIEPSGVFDIDEFFDILREPPLDRWYDIGSVIGIVSARLEPELPPQGEYLLASQLASAGCVVFSRVQMATEADIAETKAHIAAAMEKIRCRRRLEGAMLIKDWDSLTEEDYSRIMNSGWYGADFVKLTAGSDTDFQSLYYFDLPVSRRQLEEKVQRLFENPEFGSVFRVKGFFREGEQWYQLNATRRETNIESAGVDRGVVIVIGTGLSEPGINELMYEGVDAVNPLEGLHLLD